MIYKPELKRKEDVERWYKSREADSPCFLIFVGVKADPKQIFAKYWGDDSSAGLVKLNEALSFIDENTINTYTIICVPYDDTIAELKVRDIEGETIRFQLNESFYSKNKEVFDKNVSIVNNLPPGEKENSHANYAIQLLERQNAELMARLNELQQHITNRFDDDDEEDMEPEPPSTRDRLMGALAGLLEKPQTAEVLGGLGSLLIQKLSGNGNNNTNRQ